jgi:4-hydroxybenzoate polyprenyltransferase
VVAMCVETNLLLHLSLNNIGFYSFVFGATLVQYNLHYLVKKSALPNSMRFQWSKKNAHVHKILAGAGLILIIAGLFSFQLHHFIFLLLLGAITLFYSLPVLPFTNKKRLKDFGVLKIFTLTLLWTLVTVWFPISQAYYTDVSFLLIFLRRFIFIFVLCLVFDIRDTAIDSKENRRTIPVISGIKKAYVICYVLLVVFVLLSLVQYVKTPDNVQLNAMVISAAATFIMIEYTKRNKSDIAYLAGIDGMMLLQALLIIIGSI